MRLKIIRPFRSYETGQTLTSVPGGAAEAMIRRGYARLADDEVESTIAEPECERATIQHKQKRRG